MQYEIKHIHDRIGITVVYVTHDQSEALTMSNRIAVFNDGVVQQLSTPDILYEKPENSFVAEFIGLNKINFLEGEIGTDNGASFFWKGAHKVPLDGYKFVDKCPSDKRSVIMGIRPENIYRSKDRLEGNVFLEVKLPVSRSELTGGDVQVWFNFEGQEIASRFRSSRTPNVGALTTLFLDVKNASLFDEQTGERL